MRVPQVRERIKEAPAQALRGVFAGIGQLLLITDKLRNKVPAGQDLRRAQAPRAAEPVTDTTAASPAGPREEVAAGEPAPATATAAAEAVAAEPAPATPAAARRAPAKPVTPKPPTARRAPAKPGTAKPAGATPGGAKPGSARRAPAKPSAAEPGATEAPRPPKRQGTRDFDKTGNVRVLGDAEDSVAPVGAPEPVAAAEPAAVPEQVSVAAAEPASSPADSGAPLPNYDELSVASLRARLRNLDAAQVGQLADYERAHAARADVLGMFERRIAKLEAEA